MRSMPPTQLRLCAGGGFREIKLDNGRLETRWTGLFKPFAETGYLETGLDGLVGRYSEPHRHYHNLNHVRQSLDAFDRIVDDLTDPFTIEAAIWFHDVVYEPKSSKNEARSAEYASDFLSSTKLSPSVISEIDHLIRLTRQPADPSTEDEKYLIDIDLSTLGAGRELYDRYEAMIRKEYADVPEQLYKKGRRVLLSSFLDGAHIYRTRYFRERLEAQARANIVRELKKL
jgi:predicted metal-dependent HD superfamily phosphohydrolase